VTCEVLLSPPRPEEAQVPKARKPVEQNSAFLSVMITRYLYDFPLHCHLALDSQSASRPVQHSTSSLSCGSSSHSIPDYWSAAAGSVWHWVDLSLQVSWCLSRPGDSDGHR
jgi:hypothetical protein